MDLRFIFDGAETLTLKAVDQAQEPVSDKGWGVYVELNAQGEVIFYDDITEGGRWIKSLELAIKDVEDDPPKGTYTVGALGLHDAPFVDVLRAVKGYIETDGTPVSA